MFRSEKYILTLHHSLLLWFFAIVLQFGFFVEATSGQKPSALHSQKSFAQYNLDVWTIENGLPQNSINCIYQSNDGYIWLATQEGIVRFSGSAFRVFDSYNTVGILNNYIWTIYEDHNNTLWFGTNGGGIVQYAKGKFFSYTKKDGLPGDIVHSFCEDEKNNLLIATNSGLCQFANGKISPVTFGNLQFSSAGILKKNSTGSIFIGCNDGLFLFTNETCTKILSDKKIYAIAERNDGSLFIGTERGVILFQNGVAEILYENSLWENNGILSLCETSFGELWMGTAGEGIARYSNGKFLFFTKKDGLTDNFIKSMYEDREGNLWLGTYSGGLMRLKDGKFTTYTTHDGLSDDFVLTVFGDSKNNLWIGTYGGGLNKMRDGVVKVFSKKDGLQSDIISSIAEDKNGNIWIGTYGGGLARYENGKFSSITYADGLAENIILSQYCDSDGNLWIGTMYKGVSKISGETITNYTTDSGLTHNSINVILQNKKGEILFGTAGGGISVYRNGKFFPLRNDKKYIGNNITALYEDSDSTLWIGTDGNGLCKYANGSFTSYTHAQGLFDNVVFHIEEDANKNLWMSSNKGIFCVSKIQIDEFDRKIISTLQCVSFGKEDGMKSSECNGRRQPSGCKTADGKLWFPTIKGVAVIDPQNIQRNEQIPPIVIEEIFVDGKEILHEQNEFTPGAEKFEFHYAALSYAAPQRVQFKYKLEGYDNDWINAGNRNLAFYTSLPPGKYRFTVLGSNSDGIWSKQSAAFAFELHPHFYQTPLFALLCVIGVLLLGSNMYSKRLKKIQFREEELMKLVEVRTKDVSAQKQKTEQALKETERARKIIAQSELKFRTLIQNSSDMIMILTLDGVVQYVSPSVKNILGYEENELVKKNLLDTIHSEDRKELQKIFQKDSALLNLPRTIEIHIQSKEGSWLTLEAVSNSFSDNNATSGIILNTRDITERKKLEHSLIQAQKLEGIATLITGIAHNFNNIMGIILGYASLIKIQSDKESVEKNVAIIEGAVERGAGLVRQLLTFAKKSHAQLSPVDINEIVKSLFSFIKDTFPRTLTIQENLSEQKLFIAADQSQIYQALLNLCVNAKDAMHKDGKIALSTFPVRFEEVQAEHPEAMYSDYVCISISDNGRGMNEETRRRIFEPFFTTKDLSEATGLGLAVVHGIVESHNGFIKLESAEGHGSSFRVFLPLTKEKIAIAERLSTIPVQFSSSSKTILLVEDEEFILASTEKVLKGKGYNVITATDGEEALEIYKEYVGKIDLIFTDHGLPRISGWDAFQKMQIINPNTLCIFASGYIPDELQIEMKKKGVNAFLNKPYDPNDVLKIVQRVLTKQH